MALKKLLMEVVSDEEKRKSMAFQSFIPIGKEELGKEKRRTCRHRRGGRKEGGWVNAILLRKNKRGPRRKLGRRQDSSP